MEGRQMLLNRSKHRALTCLYEQEYSRAFAHFLVALTVEPTVKGELMHAFLFTLDKLTEKLENEGKLNDVLMCYEQALEILPQDSNILHGLATLLYRFGYLESATSYFLKSYQECPYFTPSLYCMENLKNALVERWHFVMLNDTGRNLAYSKAIKKAILSGYRTVLDIGAGTGILSMMAFDTGAEKVYACEASEMMFTVLQNILKANDKDIQAFPKLSNDLSINDIGERVSLVVTEIFDASLFGEHCLATLSHAWEHLLQNPEINKEALEFAAAGDSYSVPSIHTAVEDTTVCNTISADKVVGKIIPCAATVYAVPLECGRIQTYLRLEDNLLESLGLKEVLVVPVVAEEEPYISEKIDIIPGGYKMLCEANTLLNVNFNSIEDIKKHLNGLTISASYKCQSAGRMDAIAVWFNLHLDEEIGISTAPEDKGCWEQAIFLVGPQHMSSSPYVNIGDEIEVVFQCKGHLTLQSIKSTKMVEDVKFENSLSMDASLIYLLNAFSCGNNILKNLANIFKTPNCSVVDVSTFPLLGLKLLEEDINTVTVLKNQYHRVILEIQDYCKLSNEKLQFKSYEELFSSQIPCDYLIVDPIDLCGLLKKNVLEDIAMLRKQCLNDTVVVPGEIEIHIVLIESKTLNEHSKIISDERTAGYKISQIMNAYQCRIHQDIQSSTLDMKKLSKSLTLCKINMNSSLEEGKLSVNISLQGTLDVEVISDGKITGILFWFEMRYSPEIVINTADPETLWKQAACVMTQEIPVAKSDKLCLQWTCRNSCFDVCIKDSKVCSDT